MLKNAHRSITKKNKHAGRKKLPYTTTNTIPFTNHDHHYSARKQPPCCASRTGLPLNERPVPKSHSVAFFEFTVNTFEVLKPTGNLLSGLSVLSKNCSTCSQNFHQPSKLITIGFRTWGVIAKVFLLYYESILIFYVPCIV
jgi:hypothetical protein